MSPGADVRSIDGLREWVAAAQVFGHDAAEALGGVRVEIRRAFEWVNEQGELWARAVRSTEQEVVQAKADLAARRFPGFDGKMPDTTLQERNLRRAEAKLEHAREQVRRCRSWASRLPKVVEEAYSARSNRLQNFLEGELPKALAGLARRVEALEQYADLRADFSSAPSNLPPPPEPKS
jgi:hypothetical protein